MDAVAWIADHFGEVSNYRFELQVVVIVCAGVLVGRFRGWAPALLVALLGFTLQSAALFAFGPDACGGSGGGAHVCVHDCALMIPKFHGPADRCWKISVGPLARALLATVCRSKDPLVHDAYTCGG